MNTTIDINGRTFEVHKSSKISRSMFCCGERDLYDVYRNPSLNKRLIYNDWMKWADNCLRVTGFGVYNGNSQTFVLHGFFRDIGGKLYGLKITAWHNYAYELND